MIVTQSSLINLSCAANEQEATPSGKRFQRITTHLGLSGLRGEKRGSEESGVRVSRFSPTFILGKAIRAKFAQETLLRLNIILGRSSTVTVTALNLRRSYNSEVAVKSFC
jgi:hypothetical protein